jgi:hypothetical protein
MLVLIYTKKIKINQFFVNLTVFMNLTVNSTQKKN